jgi:hypothetical protein
MAKRLFELNMSACLMPSDLAARRRTLLAQSGHPNGVSRCLLLGVKRTLRFQGAMSAFDPKRTFADLIAIAVLTVR